MGLLRRDYLNYPEAFVRKGKMKEAYRGISDIINGMTNGSVKLGFGHESEYWKPGKLQSEAFAQFGRFYFDGNASVLKMVTELFPDTVRNMDNIVRAISHVRR